MEKLKFTGYLFSKPNFYEGVASLIDIGGNLLKFNDSNTPEDADRKAIVSDWLAICEDFKNTVEDNVK